MALFGIIAVAAAVLIIGCIAVFVMLGLASLED